MSQIQRARNVGSNFTTFRYAGKNIAYLEMVQDSGQSPVGGAEPVHPLGSRHPVEIVTSRAINAGTLTLGIKELWHQEVWQQMQGLANTHDIIEVFETLARRQNAVTCAKIITPPDGKKYGKTYHNVVIIRVPDEDNITLATLSVTKQVTVMYTHTTPLG